MKLLATTEGIFARNGRRRHRSGHAQKLIEQGRIPRDQEVVICVTGNGLKTQESLEDKLLRPAIIRPSLAAFEGLLEKNLEGALV